MTLRGFGVMTIGLNFNALDQMSYLSYTFGGFFRESIFSIKIKNKTHLESAYKENRSSLNG